VILIVGALVLNEMRSSLVDARKASLNEMADIIASVLTEAATEGEPRPRLITDQQTLIRPLKRMQISGSTRLRVFEPGGEVVADSYLLDDRIAGQPLPPVRTPNALQQAWLDVVRNVNSTIGTFDISGRAAVLEARSLDEEVVTALGGDPVASERFNDSAQRVISVTVPIRRVGKVVGALTLESSDVARIIAAERAALVPFIIFAVLTAVVTSALLTAVIARPLIKLARASDRVRTGDARRLDLGALHDRRDEIGHLAKAMEAMTASLYDRIVANERFAADVAHELKNPLTSIRSAVETSRSVRDPAVQTRMLEVIHKDVIRLDRLITDISNLSRLEGEIIREKSARVDLARLLEDLVSIYRDTRREGEPEVRLGVSGVGDGAFVMGRDGPLAQVIRNLVENAKSFSPPEGVVRVELSRGMGLQGPLYRIAVEDEGPGVPPDKLEKVFERFYSDRPKGATFGNNSGLGLSIVRQIVETHRGRVWAENRIKPDGGVAGARFVVEIPAAPAAL
jgi:two-component system, OmpR family, sensor histidine kinase ChvG